METSRASAGSVVIRGKSSDDIQICNRTGLRSDPRLHPTACCLSSAPTFPELWEKIEPLMSSGILVAHNAVFDLGVLKKCLNDYGKRQNYMTVPAAVKELEKIEMLKGGDNEYRLDYAVTATQKAILKAFGMTATNVQKQANAISSDLARLEIEAFEKAAAAAAQI